MSAATEIKAAAKAAENVAKIAVTPAPVSVQTTAANVVVKFSKQYAIAVVGTAAVTVGVVKVLEVRKNRKLVSVLRADLDEE